MDLRLLNYWDFWKLNEIELKNKLLYFLKSDNQWDWTNSFEFHSCLLQELDSLDDFNCILVAQAIDRCYNESEYTERLLNDPQITFIFKEMTLRSPDIINSLHLFEFYFIFNILKRRVYLPFLEEYIVKIAENLVSCMKYNTLEKSRFNLAKQLFLSFDAECRELYLRKHMKENFLRQLERFYLTNVNFFGEYQEGQFKSQVCSMKGILERKCENNKQNKKRKIGGEKKRSNKNHSNIRNYKNNAKEITEKIVHHQMIQTPKGHLFLMEPP